MLSKDTRKIETIAKASMLGNLGDTVIGKQQQALRHLHTLGLDILSWRLTYAFTEAADKIVLVHMAELSKIADEQARGEVILDMTDSRQDWF